MPRLGRPRPGDPGLAVARPVDGRAEDNGSGSAGWGGDGWGAASVALCCTARLHLGFLDLNGGLGRRFGSIGLSLDRPRTSLVLSRAVTDSVRGPEAERAEGHLAAMRRHLGLSGGHSLLIEEAIPAHSGLGSGTQLALLVAGAVRRLHGLGCDLRGDAALLGRGHRSGVGIGLFRDGGVVVDGGPGAVGQAERPGDAVPQPAPLLCRLELPPAWRVLLVLDRAAAGLSGAGERAAFARLGPMTAADSGEICRHVLMQVLPAVAEGDLSAFGAGLSRIQALLGEYFAPVQGGRFTSARVAAALAVLADAGAVGIGQSSWGPTGFAFAGNAAEAERLAGLDLPQGVDLLICRGLNHGASVREPASA